MATVQPQPRKHDGSVQTRSPMVPAGDILGGSTLWNRTSAVQKAAAAAPELMVAGLSLPEGAEWADARCHYSPPLVAAPPGRGTRITGHIALTAGHRHAAA